MPTPTQLSDEQVAQLFQLYSDAEIEILREINRGLLKGNQLDYLQTMHQNVQAILNDLLSGSKGWCEDAIPRLYTSGVQAADQQLKQIGAKITPGFGAIHQQAAQVLADNAYGRFRDVNDFIGRRVDDVYRNVALESIRGSTIGYQTWQQAALTYRSQLAEQGITGFRDAAGRQWNMRTYAEMVARTSTMECHLEGTKNRLLEHDHDLVVVSSHYKPCGKCIPWEGKVLSLTGQTSGYPTLDEAKSKGLFHPNCRHTYGLHMDLDAEIEDLEKELGEKAEPDTGTDTDDSNSNKDDSSKAVDKKMFPDELAGVKRGKEMTREEANLGKPNPNYGRGGGYTVNCQSCVVSFEARLRGYDVKTLPNTKGSKLEELSKQTNKAWLDPKTGKHPDYMYDDAATTPKKFLKFLESSIEKDKRYTLQFSWKGRGRTGHIVSLDRDKGGALRLYDPQCGVTCMGGEVAKYLEQVKYTRTVYGQKTPARPKLLRVDDKQFNSDMVNYILEGVQK